MKRAVYIGGFGNGRGSAERVADALGQRYEDVDPFTFVQAMENPETIRRAVRGADVITHSAGMLALKDTRPENIGSIGAPLPTSAGRLVLKAAVKTVRMHTPGIGIRSARDIGCVMAYDLSAVGEFTVHGHENLGRLPQISKFNAVDAALAAEDAGIPVMLGYNNGDEFFNLSAAEEKRATDGGVAVVRMPGLHDQLVLTPDEVIQQFLDVPAEAIGRIE